MLYDESGDDGDVETDDDEDAGDEGVGIMYVRKAVLDSLTSQLAAPACITKEDVQALVEVENVPDHELMVLVDLSVMGEAFDDIDQILGALGPQVAAQWLVDAHNDTRSAREVSPEGEQDEDWPLSITAEEWHQFLQDHVLEEVEEELQEEVQEEFDDLDDNEGFGLEQPVVLSPQVVVRPPATKRGDEFPAISSSTSTPIASAPQSQANSSDCRTSSFPSKGSLQMAAQETVGRVSKSRQADTKDNEPSPSPLPGGFKKGWRVQAVKNIKIDGSLVVTMETPGTVVGPSSVEDQILVAFDERETAGHTVADVHISEIELSESQLKAFEQEKLFKDQQSKKRAGYEAMRAVNAANAAAQKTGQGELKPSVPPRFVPPPRSGAGKQLGSPKIDESERKSPIRGPLPPENKVEKPATKPSPETKVENPAKLEKVAAKLPVRSKGPGAIGLQEGMKVMVRTDFLSDSKRPVRLKANEIGTVQRINSDGYAEILFSDHQKSQLVGQNNFGKLQEKKASDGKSTSPGTRATSAGKAVSSRAKPKSQQPIVSGKPAKAKATLQTSLRETTGVDKIPMTDGNDLAGWLRDVAKISRSAIESTSRKCKDLGLRSVEDLAMCDKDDLRRIFTIGVTMRIINALKPIAPVATGTTPGLKSGRYTFVELLGKKTSTDPFSNGEVWLAKRDDDFLCSIRRTIVQGPKQVTEVIQDAFIMAELNHSCLVQLVHEFAYLEELTYGMLAVHTVMEYCSGGSLKDLILSGEVPTVETVSHVIASVAEALDYMHEQHNLAHRRISPKNVLLHRIEGKPTLVKVRIGYYSCEIGTSSLVDATGNALYMPPDVDDGVVRSSVDIWALGRLAIELASCVLATEVLRTTEEVEAKLLSIPDSYSDSFCGLVCEMLDFYEDNRPSARQVVDNEAIQDFAAEPTGDAEESANQGDESGLTETFDLDMPRNGT